MSYKILLDKLRRKGVLKTGEIIEAFQKVDRVDFITENYLEHVYEDKALPIGYGQTISQPTTVAFMMELLQPQTGDNVLDVGSGSGWTTAILSELVGKTGRVTGVEIVPELVDFGKENLGKYSYLNTQIIQAETGLGYPENGPYDAILVSAAAGELPKELPNQLKVGGRLVIPIKNSIYKYEKLENQELKKEAYYGFVFVPLIHSQG